MFQQKSRVVVLALLVVLSWAPIASAAETRGGFFDGLMQQLAVFLGLADEAGPNPLPDGLTQEAGPNFSPDGIQGSPVPSNEAGPDWVPGGLSAPPTPINEAGPDWSPGG